ncbi:hypothetical protein LJC74_01020 [Eubacteriales bacterium OttesenSCG-928-A19]|nr:hypothetical protein [Eubacteriales bacterium OttesenSCG-928-A19]
MPDQNQNVVYDEGYYEGVLDLYYALMTTQDTATSAPVYEKPQVLAKSIEVTITPAYREGKLHASNATVRNIKRIDTYGVKLNVAKIAYNNIQRVMGRAKDSNGVQIVTGSAIVPYLALGFACTLDDGTKEFWWLYKGNFAELTKSAKTLGEKTEYQTPTVEGTFIRRQDNDALAAIADTADKSIPQSTIDGWYEAVYEPAPATIPPEEPEEGDGG